MVSSIYQQRQADRAHRYPGRPLAGPQLRAFSRSSSRTRLLWLNRPVRDQVLEASRRDGGREQVPLPPGAPEIAQTGLLVHRLDALGDHDDTQVLAELHDRAHKFCSAVVLAQPC